MSVIRAFIAVNLPEEVQQCLSHIQTMLKEELDEIPIRWIPTKNIHLTLKFLGDVSENNIDVLTQMLEIEIESHQAFEFSIGGIGAYPKMRRPRVIWIGVQMPPELISLQRIIEAQTSRLGYEPAKRPFSGHLTLGRVSRSAKPGEIKKIGDILSGLKIGFLGIACTEFVHLYRSDLKPGGAVYTPLFTAQLLSPGIRDTI